jgi:hypothetical protein
MRPNLRSLQRSAILGMALLLSVQAVQAQPTRPRPSDTLSTRARDSLIAAVLADTLDEDLDATLDGVLPLRPRVRHSVTMRPTARSYRVGAIDARESSGFVNYTVRTGRTTVRVDLTPVTYRGDTSAQARPIVSFSGATPITARVDVRVRSADTLRLFGQTSSFPSTLGTVDATALGAIGTSTIDLDTYGLGVASRIGGRYALSVPVGDDGVTLALRGGLEYEPRPSGAQPVSWRGTTVRGGIGVSRVVNTTTVSGQVDLMQSVGSDSLGGRNLFPGGGSVNVEGRLMRTFGEDELRSLFVNAFYSRPFGLERPDQPTRLIPIGDFMGATVSSFLPLKSVTMIPTVSLLRESSSATAQVGTVRTALTASGYTASASLAASVPLGAWLTITPEAGVATGTVTSRTSASFPRRIQRPLTSSFSDGIRGGWVALEVTIAR